MLKVLLIGYIIIVIYHLYQAYIDSEIEDQKDVEYILGLMVGSILWPLIWLVMIICATVEAYFEEEI